jgi:hypothetical protein
MIDTLQEAKKLEAAGFAPEQAAAIVEIQWRSPSWVLRNLEKSGFERKQAEAILDFYWSVRNETLMPPDAFWLNRRRSDKSDHIWHLFHSRCLVRLAPAIPLMTIKPPIREANLCQECGYLLHFRANAYGRLVAYCDGCEIEIPVVSVPQVHSASGASKNALTNHS